MADIQKKWTPAELRALIAERASARGIDPKLALAVAQIESGFNHLAVSGAGAQGTFQLMPGTARELGVTNPFDPIQNIEGGLTYLDKMLKLYNGDERLALAAYNAGPGRVKEYGGEPPFTTSYINKVLSLRGNPMPNTQIQAPPRVAPTLVQSSGLTPEDLQLIQAALTAPSPSQPTPPQTTPPAGSQGTLRELFAHPAVIGGIREALSGLHDKAPVARTPIYGLTPNQVLAQQQADQQAEQEQARLKFEQEKEIARATEAEKSRAAAIKLEELRAKNDEKIAKLQVGGRLAEATMKEKGDTAIANARMTQEAAMAEYKTNADILMANASNALQAQHYTNILEQMKKQYDLESNSKILEATIKIAGDPFSPISGDYAKAFELATYGLGMGGKLVGADGQPIKPEDFSKKMSEVMGGEGEATYSITKNPDGSITKTSVSGKPTTTQAPTTTAPEAPSTPVNKKSSKLNVNWMNAPYVIASSLNNPNRDLGVGTLKVRVNENDELTTLKQMPSIDQLQKWFDKGAYMVLDTGHAVTKITQEDLNRAKQYSAYLKGLIVE